MKFKIRNKSSHHAPSTINYLLSNKAQSILEYSILIIIILAVFLSMQMYVKRGVQGHWKTSVDQFGDQYDPRVANSYVMYTLSTTSNSMIDVVSQTTIRTDSSSSMETKAGSTVVGDVKVQQ